MKFKVGDIPWNKGIACSEEIKLKISNSSKGRKAWNKGIACSEECKKKNRESHLGKNNVSWKEKIKKICLICNKKFEVLPSYRNAKFCSKKCFGIYASQNYIGEKSSGWKGGITEIKYCEKFNEILKEKIRDRDGRVCQECGKIELENGRKLDVHHIHYDKPNCDPDLIALCISCNVKSNYNRDYWEEYFMNKLKERNLLKLEK